VGHYQGRRVLVAGAGVSGVAVAEALLARGAVVTVTDRPGHAGLAALAGRGATTFPDAAEPPGGTEEVIVSPGFRPDHPLVLAAQNAGIEVFSEPELAWRLRPAGAAPWLAVTGTNGKTTTVTMLASILSAAGLRTVATGNIGYPLLDAVLDPEPYDVLAVELSSFQLHWSTQLAPEAGALLNLADDHLDWHGGFDAYADAKAALWRGSGVAVGNADDPRVAKLLANAPGRTVGFTLGTPAPGQLGVVEDILVDRAFGPDGPAGSRSGPLGPAGSRSRPLGPVDSRSGPLGPVDSRSRPLGPEYAVELGTVADVRPPGPHNVANALAAAALARAHGVPAEAVARGLRAYTPEPHRNAFVASVGGVDWVDDSKATNPHAAAASLLSYPRIVWVAGGQLKGVDVDDLVRLAAPRLAGAVLLGVDRAEIATALARHAPDLPVVEVASTDDGAMAEVVAAAARLARPGDTVLLAPAAASKDMFASFERRGEAFAAAVAALGGQ
jgi:UDP-N-acetylmuramoylalanine--D-glutamate ligase